MIFELRFPKTTWAKIIGKQAPRVKAIELSERRLGNNPQKEHPGNHRIKIRGEI